jgi:hypothetical protein
MNRTGLPGWPRAFAEESGWRFRKAAVRLSDARYRAARPLRTVTGRARNWRRRRFLETGKGYALERATRRVRSSLPVYRDRVNPATGRQRRDDAEIYRRRDSAFATMRERRIAPSPDVRAQDYAPHGRSR